MGKIFGGSVRSNDVGGFESELIKDPGYMKQYNASLARMVNGMKASRDTAIAVKEKRDADPNYKPTEIELQHLNKLEQEMRMEAEATSNALADTIGQENERGWLDLFVSIPEFVYNSVWEGIGSTFGKDYGTSTQDYVDFVRNKTTFSKEGIKVSRKADGTYQKELSDGTVQQSNADEYNKFLNEQKEADKVLAGAVKKRADSAKRGSYAEEFGPVMMGVLNTISQMGVSGLQGLNSIARDVIQNPSNSIDGDFWKKLGHQVASTLGEVILDNVPLSADKREENARNIAYHKNLAKEYDKILQKKLDNKTANDLVRESAETVAGWLSLNDRGNTSKETHNSRVDDVEKILNKVLGISKSLDAEFQEWMDSLQESDQARSVVNEEVKKAIGFDATFTGNTGSVSKEMVEVNGKVVPKERDSVGNSSAFDIEELVYDSKGRVVQDEEGNPLYKSKYGFFEAISRSNFSVLLNPDFAAYTLGPELLEEAPEALLGFFSGGASKLATSTLKKVVQSTTGAAIKSRGLTVGTLAAIDTFKESGLIASETKSAVVDQLIDKELGDKTDVNLIAKQLMEENSELSASNALYMATQIAKARRDSWATKNAKAAALINARGDMAYSTAFNTNNLSFITNYAINDLFVRKVKTTDNLRKNPLSLGVSVKGFKEALDSWKGPFKGMKGFKVDVQANALKPIKEVLKQAGSEAFEEGVINTISERSGVAVGMGEYYDAVHDIVNWDSEQVESALIGALIGGGMSSIGVTLNTVNDINTYKQQQEMLNKLKIENPAVLDSLLASYKAERSASMFFEAKKDIDKDRKEGRILEANVKSSELFHAQLIQHAQSGTLGEYIRTLDKLMKPNANTSPEQMRDLQAMKERALTIQERYEDLANTPGVNVAESITNFANRMTIEDTYMDLLQYEKALENAAYKKDSDGLLALHEDLDKETFEASKKIIAEMKDLLAQAVVTSKKSYKKNLFNQFGRKTASERERRDFQKAMIGIRNLGMFREHILELPERIKNDSEIQAFAAKREEELKAYEIIKEDSEILAHETYLNQYANLDARRKLKEAKANAKKKFGQYKDKKHPEVLQAKLELEEAKARFKHSERAYKQYLKEKAGKDRDTLVREARAANIARRNEKAKAKPNTNPNPNPNPNPNTNPSPNPSPSNPASNNTPTTKVDEEENIPNPNLGAEVTNPQTPSVEALTEITFASQAEKDTYIENIENEIARILAEIQNVEDEDHKTSLMEVLGTLQSNLAIAEDASVGEEQEKEEENGSEEVRGKTKDDLLESYNEMVRRAKSNGKATSFSVTNFGYEDGQEITSQMLTDDKGNQNVLGHMVAGHVYTLGPNIIVTTEGNLVAIAKNPDGKSIPVVLDIPYTLTGVETQSVSNTRRELLNKDDSSVKAKLRSFALRSQMELDANLGRKATFWDFLDYMVEKHSRDYVFENFSWLEYAWMLTGRPTSLDGYVDIHDEYFASAGSFDDILQSGVLQTGDEIFNQSDNSPEEINTITETPLPPSTSTVTSTSITDEDENPDETEEVEEEIEEEVEDEIEDNTITEFDYSTHQVADSNIRVAGQGMKFEKDEDGIITTSYDVHLGDSALADGNDNWWNHEVSGEGATVNIVPMSYEEAASVMVTNFVLNSKEGIISEEKVPFGSLFGPDDVGSPQYIARVPMKVVSEGGQEINFLHPVDWYNSRSVGNVTDKRKVIEQARYNLMAVRQTAFNNGGLKATIGKRRMASFAKVSQIKNDNRIEDKEATHVPIADMDPTTKIAVATDHGILTVAGAPLDLNEIEIVGTKAFSAGMTYDLRYLGTSKEGKPRYVALKTLGRDLRAGESLDEASYTTIKKAMTAAMYLAIANKYDLSDKYNSDAGRFRHKMTEAGMDEASAKHIVQEVQRIMGFDLMNFDAGVDGKGMAGFLSLFGNVDTNIPVFMGKIENRETYVDHKTGRTLNRYPNNAGYALFNEGYFTMFKKTEENRDLPYKEASKGYQYSFKNPSIIGANLMLDNLFPQDRKKSPFYYWRDNTSAKHIGAGVELVQIEQDNFVSGYDEHNKPHGVSGYDWYIMNTRKTDVYARRVYDKKTKKVVYVTNLQPVLELDVPTAELDTSSADITLTNVSTTTRPPKGEEQTNVPPAGNLPDGLGPVAETVPEVQPVFDSFEDEISNLDPALRAELESLSFQGLEEDILNLGIDGDVSNSRRTLTDEMAEEFANIGIPGIEGLSRHQYKMAVKSLYGAALDVLSTIPDRTNADVVRALNSTITDRIIPEKERTLALMEKIDQSKFPMIHAKLQIKADKLQSIEDAAGTLLFSEEGQGILVKKIYKDLKIKLTAEEDSSLTSEQVEHLHDQDSTTKNIKASFTKELQIFFSGVQARDENNKPKVNFMGIPEYVPAKDVIAVLRRVLVNTEPSYDTLINNLKAEMDDPIARAILAKFESGELSDDIVKQILYNLTQNRLEMRSILTKLQEVVIDPTITAFKRVVRLFNPNGNARSAKKAWKNAWKLSKMFTPKSNGRKTVHVVNLDVVKDARERVVDFMEEVKLLPEFKDRNATIPEAYIEDLSAILQDLGIFVDNKVVNALMKESGFGLVQGKGLLPNIKTFYDTVLREGKDTELSLERSYNTLDFFTIYSTRVAFIADLEFALSKKPIVKSFRVDGNNYQGSVQTMMVYRTVDRLKRLDKTLFNVLKKIPLSSNNALLGLLENSDMIRGLYNVEFIGPNAIAEQDNPDNKSGKIQTLSPADRIITELGFFTHTEKELNGLGDRVLQFTNGIPLRMARMFNPAASDKSTQPVYTIPVLALTKDHLSYEVDAKGNPVVRISDDVVLFLTEQIFGAELNRIFMAIEHEKDINIKGFSDASKVFINQPVFNEMKISIGSQRVTMVEALEMLKDPANTMVTEKLIREKSMIAAQQVMRIMLHKDYESKVGHKGSWRKAGVLYQQGNVLQTHIDNKYAKKWSSDLEEQLHLTAMDYVINSMLNQSNISQIISGDTALFAPGVKKVLDKSTGKPNFIRWAMAAGESLTKRMAMVIAPGSLLADSKDDSYLQIFVNDKPSIANIVETIIPQMYKDIKEIPEATKVILETINSTDQRRADALLELKGDELKVRLAEINAEYKKSVEDLETLYPELAPYFNIEGTDAQEYTTWQEHFDVVFRQGRLKPKDKKLLESAYAKLKQDPNTKLTADELMAIVTNPIKPVYTGQEVQYARNPDGTYDKDNPLFMRTVYVKSSSFPLLPQLTAGLELDAVRQKMERLATMNTQNAYRTKKPTKGVRLVYISGAKIGAPSNAINIEDLYYRDFDEIFQYNEQTGAATGMLADSIVELSRENFRIQLDVPDKMSKHLEERTDDSLLMGSQIWKLRLGNGINKIKERVFTNAFSDKILEFAMGKVPGVKKSYKDKKTGKRVKRNLNGAELDGLATLIESTYSKNQMTMLRQELGLKEDGTIKDRNFTMRALRKIIESELATKDYPEYVVDGLDLVELEKDGGLDLEFLIPLWMSPEANKFESMLQAIITNRLIKFRLPGYQHVSASAEGFREPLYDKQKTKVGAFEDLPYGIRNRIVWATNKKINELKSTRYKNGKLRYSQVLIKSHFRRENPDGTYTLVDLTKEPYSKYDEQLGRYILQADALPSELREMFSFRIPTSALQSGAMLAVVGFLPPESGDTIVVPKEHTVQIGEDFDVDKRSVYKLHYTFDKEGRIRMYELPKHMSFDEPFEEVDFQMYESTLSEVKAILDMMGERNKYEKALQTFLKLAAIQYEINTLEKDPDVQDGDLKDLYKEQKESLDLLEATYPNYTREELIADAKAEIANIDAALAVLDMAPVENFKKYRKVKNLQKARQKALENAMVQTYTAIYTSQSQEVQSKIMQILSFKFAKDTVKAIQDQMGIGNNRFFNIFSDEYQAKQMNSGAAGKTGISVWSNGVVAHAQYERLPEDKKVRINKMYSFGSIVSEGILGLTNTLDGFRTISDNLAEGQNSATDNVKEGIMAARNENDITLNVFLHLAKLGVDSTPDLVKTLGNPKGERLSIPSLMMTQPIMWDYVEIMRNKRGVTSSFSGDPVKSTIRQLISDFDLGEYFDDEAISSGEYDKLFKQPKDSELSYEEYINLRGAELFKGQNLYDSINRSVGTKNKELQAYTLAMFLSLEKDAEALREYESVINLSTSGLGQSYFNVLDKVDLLVEMHDNQEIPGIGNIVGDFIRPENPDEEELRAQGYLPVDKGVWVRPTTSEGHVAVNAILTADKLMQEVFPYRHPKVRQVIEAVLDMKGGAKNLSKKKKDEIRYKAMEALKEYFFNNPDSGLFEGPISVERHRIFLDKQTSLPVIINQVKTLNPKYVESNTFLQNLDWVKDKGLAMNTASDDNSEKSDNKDAFVEMLHDNTTVIATQDDGTQITPQMLALDIATYAYLGRNLQGLVSLREVVPIEALKILGVTDYTRSSPALLDDLNVGGFLRQFLQHNPSEAPSVSTRNIDIEDILVVSNSGETILNSLLQAVKSGRGYIIGRLKDLLVPYLQEIELSSEEKFVHIKVDKDIYLFERTPKGTYTQIETAEHEMFNYYDYDGEYIIPFEEKAKENSTSVVRKIAEDPASAIGRLFNSNRNKQGVISNNESVAKMIFSPMAMDMMSSLEAKAVELGAKIVTDNTFDKVRKDEIARLKKLGRNSTVSTVAFYDPKTNTVHINPKMTGIKPNPGETVEEIFFEVYMEELMHVVNRAYMRQFLVADDPSRNTIEFKEGTPQEIIDLGKMYLEVRGKGIAPDIVYNFDEFIANAIGNKELRDQISKEIPSFGERFLKAIKRIFNLALGETSSLKELDLAMDAYLRYGGVAHTVADFSLEVRATLDIAGIEQALGDIPGAKLSFGFNVIPHNSKDAKAVSKASISNKFIGHGVSGSATASYAVQAGAKRANTGKYEPGDVVFVSINGKGSNAKSEELRKAAQDKTIKEAILALNSGATIITDSKAYIESSTYNTGELRLMKNLEHLGFVYSETKVDGFILGQWHKPITDPNKMDFTPTHPEDSTLYSGGAEGYDKYWVASKNNHRNIQSGFVDFDTDDYKKLDKRAKNEVEELYYKAVAFLGRKTIPADKYSGQLVRRDMLQAMAGDVVYAVSEIIPPGVKGPAGYSNTKGYPVVEGGTGYAVAAAIALNKPVYVFNHADFGMPVGWYKWDPAINNFLPVETPMLSAKPIGIGSRRINDVGRKAIDDVVQKTIEYVDSTDTGEYRENPEMSDKSPLKAGYEHVRIAVGNPGDRRPTYAIAQGREVTKDVVGTVLDIPGERWFYVDYNGAKQIINYRTGMSLPSKHVTGFRNAIEETLKAMDVDKERVVLAISNWKNIYTNEKISITVNNSLQVGDTVTYKGDVYTIRRETTIISNKKGEKVEQQAFLLSNIDGTPRPGGAILAKNLSKVNSTPTENPKREEKTSNSKIPDHGNPDDYTVVNSARNLDTVTSLEQDLIDGFLADFGIDVTTYKDIKEVLGYDAAVMADFITKQIVANEGESITPAAIFMAQNMLGRTGNRLVSRMNLLLKSWDGYQESFDRHSKQVYVERGWMHDTGEWYRLVRERVKYDFLQQKLEEYYANPVEFEKVNNSQWTSEDWTTFKRFLRDVENFLRKLGIHFQSKASRKKELDNIAYSIAAEMVDRNYQYFDFRGRDPESVLKEYDSTLDTDPVAKDIIQRGQGIGLILSGSIVIRKDGTLYRTEKESLHDIDWIVPYELNTNKDNSFASAKIRSLYGSKDSEIVSETKKILPEFSWYKDFLKEFPTYQPLNVFFSSVSYDKSVTVTGVIDGEFYSEDGVHTEVKKVLVRNPKTKIAEYVDREYTIVHKKGDYIKGTGYNIDFFINFEDGLTDYNGSFQTWQSVMVAKAKMGRLKDMNDWYLFETYNEDKLSESFKDAKFTHIVPKRLPEIKKCS